MSQLVTVAVPDIGDFEDVEVVEILVQPGDAVAADDSLISIESDKATLEVPAPCAGIVRAVTVALGDRVSQGSSIVELEAESGAVVAAPRVAGPDGPASKATGVAALPSRCRQSPPATRPTHCQRNPPSRVGPSSPG